MFYQTKLRSITLIAALGFLSCYASFGSYFAREIVVEIIILAILAISLDLCAGFGGMVSLCHGAIMGVAAYAFAIMSAKLGWPLFPSALIGLLAAVMFSGLVGWVTARTNGIFFIMATLAFGQMAHTFFFKSRWLGGDDGMGGISRFDLSIIGININDSLIFAYAGLVMLLAAYGLTAIVMRSGFGRTLSGIHVNEDRMKALGVNTAAHRAKAMAFSGLIAGIAGMIAAQHTLYISPELLIWTTSGEALIVVILGGLGTLIGPVIGAILLVFMKHEISNYTDYWHAFVGLVLIFTVLAGGRGVFGQIEYWLNILRSRHHDPNNHQTIAKPKGGDHA